MRALNWSPASIATSYHTGTPATVKWAASDSTYARSLEWL
jgi:hypothetical protein